MKKRFHQLKTIWISLVVLLFLSASMLSNVEARDYKLTDSDIEHLDRIKNANELGRSLMFLLSIAPITIADNNIVHSAYFLHGFGLPGSGFPFERVQKSIGDAQYIQCQTVRKIAKKARYEERDRIESKLFWTKFLGQVNCSRRQSAIRTIYATDSWLETGIYVNQGDDIEVIYESGAWKALPWGSSYDADGSYDTTAHDGYPVPGAPMGALIGRIGGSSPFYIGNHSSLPTTNRRGKLELAINDDLDSRFGAGIRDNWGSIEVRIVHNR